MLKVVVYYRSRKTRNLANGTAVTLLQKGAVEQWAKISEVGPESGKWKITAQYHDNYKGRDNHKWSDLPGLDKAIAHCEEADATLVFVNVKIWRPNPFIDDRVDNFIRKHGKDRVFVIPTTKGEGADEIRDFFEQKSKDRKRKKLRKRVKKGIHDAKTEKGSIRNPKNLKEAQSRGGQTKRAKSLRHLIPIALLILDFDKMKLSNQQIADKLNQRNHFTVSGKKWTPASISKVRSEISKSGFRDRVINAMQFLNPNYKPAPFVNRLPN